MRKKCFLTILLLSMMAFSVCAEDLIEHGVVYHEPGRFAGWPANNGIWAWDNEIVVGFTLGYYKENPSGHDIDSDRPSTTRQARSLDGGVTWTIETPSYLGENGKERPIQAWPGAIDFSRADFAARFRGDRFFYSYDRCHTWEGPFQLPDFGRPGLLARTDYVVNDSRTLTAFIATEKDGGGEGWPCCIRTEDGGVTWKRVGWIGRQPPSGYGYSIMPATIRLGEKGYLSMIRRAGVEDGQRRWWLEGYVSPDNGQSWYLLDQPQIDNAGNPAAMVQLEDGRIALAYGWRKAPYGLRARISNDAGQTWGDEIVLRDDGASWDIGYPRMIQRPDGMCLVIYYYQHPDQPEQYIASTLWDPGRIERFAGKVYKTWAAREPMPQFSVDRPDATLDTGYDAQKAFLRRVLKSDEIGGYKAAVVGAAGQENLGIDGPVTGIVPLSGVHSAEDDVVIPLSDCGNRHVETEIGYVFGRPISKPLESIEDLRKHVSAVAPIIEVPGGPVDERHPATAADLAAWNGNAKDIIVGAEHDPDRFDVDEIAITLTHNGDILYEARGGEAAGGQWETLFKTVNSVVSQGYVVRKGHVITNGALGKILKAEPGVYRADYGPLGQVTFTVAE